MADYRRHDGAANTGWVLLVIGLVLGGLWLIASGDAEAPRCGGESMSPGDYCSSRKGGPKSYDEMKENSGTAATLFSWGAGLLGVGGVGLVIGERTTRGLRGSLSTWRRNARLAKPVRAAEIVRTIRTTELLRVDGTGYPPRRVEAVLDQLVSSLERGDVSAAKAMIPGYLEVEQKLGVGRYQQAYFPASVDLLFSKVRGMLERPVLGDDGRPLSGQRTPPG